MHRDRRLVSCRQAARLGISRLRKPIWADPLEHLKIDIIDGELGPWLHLFGPFNHECNGRDPVNICWPLGNSIINVDAENMVIYTGPLPQSEQYAAAVARYAGVLANV